MTERTRRLIANALVGVAFLIIILFVVTHFTMTPPRPAWRREMVWSALVVLIAARLVRRWGGRATQTGTDGR